MTSPAYETDADPSQVCTTHGRFVVCRKMGPHHWTKDEEWVALVRAYQHDPRPYLEWTTYLNEYILGA